MLVNNYNFFRLNIILCGILMIHCRYLRSTSHVGKRHTLNSSILKYTITIDRRWYT